ncbi:hypothetical protein ACQEVM_21035 [Streptomyces sp. CA-243310]|uniref:hypothetical protein n=1 Tax=Streptomyces sp. CA-243310 TaxID=3240056 RepID=UPI003D8C24CE
MGPSLTEILDAAAVGHFPPPDGATTVVPQESGRDAGVIAIRVRSAGGVLVLGRGIAARREAAIEVDQDVRHKGLGRSPALAARHLVPDGAPVRSRQTAGNARSIRAFQAAGYRPIGAEALLPAPEAARAAR